MKILPIAFIALALVGCGPTATTPEAEAQSETVEQAPKDETPGIGTPVSTSDRTITVTKVETLNGITPANQFAEPIDGTIVVVRFDLTNSGNESGNLMFSQFKLEDSQGRTYDEITDMGYSLWRDEAGIKARSEDLFPGESRPDLAAFRVSPDASGFTLTWSGKKIGLD